MYDLTECRVYQDNDIVHRFDADFWIVTAGHPSTSIASNSIAEPNIPDPENYEAIEARLHATAQNDFMAFTWLSEDKNSFAGYGYKTSTGYEREVLDCWLVVYNHAGNDISARTWLYIEYITGASYRIPAAQFITSNPEGNHLIVDFSNIWDNGVQLPDAGIAKISIEIYQTTPAAPCDPLASVAVEGILLNIKPGNVRNNAGLRRWIRQPKTGRDASGIDMQISFEQHRHISPRRLFWELSSLGYMGNPLSIDCMSGGLYHLILPGPSCGEVTFSLAPGDGDINYPLFKWLVSLDELILQYGDFDINIIMVPVFRVEWSLLDGNDQHFMRDEDGLAIVEKDGVGDATGGYITPSSTVFNDYLYHIYRAIYYQFFTATAGRHILQSRGSTWGYHPGSRKIGIYDNITIADYEADTGEVVPVPWLGKIDDITDQDVANNSHYLNWLSNKLITTTSQLINAVADVDPDDEVAIEINGQDVLSGDIFPILPALFDITMVTTSLFDHIVVFAFGWMSADNDPAVEDAMMLPGTIGFDPATNAAFVIGSVDDHNNRYQWGFMDKYIDIARFDYSYHDIQVSDFAAASRDGFIWFGFGVVGVVGFDCGGGCNGL